MARPKQIDDDQLLDALRETFLELGPAASTQDLANRAGVSEGTLFKRFGTKTKIFSAAMRLPDMEERAWFIGMLDRAGKGSFEQHLVELADAMRSFFEEMMPLIHIITANGKLSRGELSELLVESEQPLPCMLLSRFEALFAREMELGRIRRVDPAALASLFVGSLSHHFHLRMHFPRHIHEDAATYCRRIVTTIIELTALPAHEPTARPLARS